MSHINDMVIMQNQIVAEQLRGLNNAFINLVFKKNSENLLCEEFEIVSKNMRDICIRYEELENKIASSASENITLWNDLKEMQTHKADLEGKLNKITTKINEHYRYLTDELKNCNAENEQLKIELQALEINSKTILDQYEHLKIKMKQLQSKKNVTENSADEKLCQRCKKVYRESDNFNWSCKIHFSTYSGEIWWCCGKKGESAPGCRSSKHECKEEEKTLGEDAMAKMSGHSLCSVIIM